MEMENIPHRRKRVVELDNAWRENPHKSSVLVHNSNPLRLTAFAVGVRPLVEKI